MKGHIIKGLILAFWVSLMLWWWHEHRLRPEPEKIDAVFLPDYFDYYSLEYNGQKVGWADKSLSRQPDGSYLAGETFTVLAAVSGQTLEARLEFLADLAPSFDLKSYRCLMRLGQHSLFQNGTVTDGRLAVELNLGQYKEAVEALYADYGHLLGERAALFNPAPVSLPAPKGPALVALLPHYLAARGLTEGQTATLPAFDPFTRNLVIVNAKVESEGTHFDLDSARDVQSFQLSLTLGSAPSAPAETLTVNRHGRVFTAEVPGYRLKREADELAARRGVQPVTLPPALKDLVSRIKPVKE